MKSTHLISLSNGTTIPSTQVVNGPNYPTIVLAHGMGMDPVQHGHNNDNFIQIATKALNEVQTWNYISYSARGHGSSFGWENTAESSPDQFQWKNLGVDMHAVAEYYNLSRYAAGGSSMGCASAIYAAIEHPQEIQGLVLSSPPVSWEARDHRRGQLHAVANRLQRKMESQPAEQHTPQKLKAHFVLRGVLASDLPPPNSTLYERIKHIPALILTTKGDPVHPVDVAEALHRLLPKSILHVRETQQEAHSENLALIRDFLKSLSQAP